LARRRGRRRRLRGLLVLSGRRQRCFADRRLTCWRWRSVRRAGAPARATSPAWTPVARAAPPRRAGLAPSPSRRAAPAPPAAPACRAALSGRSARPSAALAILARWPRLAALGWLAFGAGGDHRQRHAVAFLVHRQHPYGNDIVDGDHVVRALDVAIGDLADVHQAPVLAADVHERAAI